MPDTAPSAAAPLIVIDLQTGMFDGRFDPPIHDAGWPVWPQLGQAAGEPTFGKSVGNAFSNAELGQWVAGQGVRDVVLIGAQSDFCVAATVKGALAQGLGVTVVSD
ncbi:MAG: isochorismatase family protein, partial [Mesorhizobium sp.]